MKAKDKVSVEMTNEEAAYLYILLGHTHGNLGYNLYCNIQDALNDSEKLDEVNRMQPHSFVDLKNSDFLEDTLNKVLFTAEEGSKQQQLRELQETIQKAQEQIEKLQNE